MKLIDLFFLIRPALLCASCVFFFAGAVSSARSGTGPYPFGFMLRTVPNLILFVLVTSWAFVINQVTDVKSDRVNKKTYILPSGTVTIRESLVVLALIGVLAVILSLHRDAALRYLVWTGLALGLAYSVPPLRLKGRPVGDLLANVAAFGVIGFAMGWLVFSDIGVDLMLRSLPYSLAMAAIFLNTCIPDEAGDRVAGDRTSCVVFGRVAAGRAAVVLLALSAVAAFAVGETLCGLAVLGSMAAFVAVAAEPTSENSVIASQFSTRLLFVLVSVKAPLLGLLGVASYAAAKVYYAKRFGLDYPNLKGAQGGRSPGSSR
ncbi:MAG: UbiA family prenyltransferase [Candidatus Eisenbacteria bacterium]